MSPFKTNSKQPDTAPIAWSDHSTPHSLRYNDIYFSQQDGFAEKKHVFIEGSQLMAQFIQHQQNSFTLFETGFGTGLNYLATLQTFLEFKHDHPTHPLKYLKYMSIEATPLSLETLQRVHQNWPILSLITTELYQQWPIHFEQVHTLSFNNQVELCLWVDDIQALLASPPIQNHLTVNCWFLDGFSPAKNPAMWSLELFKFMAKHSIQGSHFATYSTARLVKEQLQRIGFSLKKQPGFAQKREMLTGSFQTRT